jgi:hypothetical protein
MVPYYHVPEGVKVRRKLKINSKHKKTLDAIFRTPTLSNVKWDDVESLLIHLGAVITEGRGSRIRFQLNEVRATFHRPHPRRETDKGTLEDVRRFLKEAGYYEI